MTPTVIRNPDQKYVLGRKQTLCERAIDTFVKGPLTNICITFYPRGGYPR